MTEVKSKYADAHVDPKGPGDARPTAMTIVKDNEMVGKLEGKVIIITGCSSGIGVETARALHATGADLYLTVRNVEAGEKVAKDILATSTGKGKVELLKLELDSLKSVRECAADFLSKSKTLNILVLNAGVMACPEGQTKDGFETQFGTNHIGHFLFFELLKPALLASATKEFNSRVVSLASSGHRFSTVQFDDLDFKKGGYNSWVAYGQAKTANIWIATEIERRYGSKGLHASAVMPGGIFTELGRHMDAETMKAMVTPAAQLNMKSVEQGAATSVWAAIGNEWEGKGGKYLENCSVAGPILDESNIMTPGYKSWAYDVEGAKKLWTVSLELVGLKDDESDK